MQLFHYHLVTSKVREVEERYLAKLGFTLVARHGRLGEQPVSYEPGTSWVDLERMGFRLRLTELEPGTLDAALCLGAAFVWGSIADAAAALRPAVRPGGFVAIGEPFWHRPPPPGAEYAEYGDLAETVERLERAGLALTGLIASSHDDWDRYESLHWRAIEEWLAEHPDDPIAPEFRRRHQGDRRDYLASQRALLGWAVFVGRKS